MGLLNSESGANSSHPDPSPSTPSTGSEHSSMHSHSPLYCLVVWVTTVLGGTITTGTSIAPAGSELALVPRPANMLYRTTAIFSASIRAVVHRAQHNHERWKKLVLSGNKIDANPLNPKLISPFSKDILCLFILKALLVRKCLVA